jgi:hypothetical protein
MNWCFCFSPFTSRAEKENKKKEKKGIRKKEKRKAV